MKKIKKSLFIILKLLSKLVLWRYQPEVIAITGSVGKTSAKEAVFKILDNKFRVRKTYSNFNNEIGVPLTIFGINKTPGKSLGKWFLLFCKVIDLIIFKDKTYPEKLILELGVDHPGDIKYLTSFIPVNIGILTKVSKVHIEFFKSTNEILKEKKMIFSNMPSGSWAILNNDDEKVNSLKKELKFKTLSYGIESGADVQATDLQILKRDDLIGTNFKIKYNGNVVPVFLPDSIGLAQVYAFLSGVCVGIIEGLNLVEISIVAKSYVPPKGRTHLLDGLNHSYIIDDTYNSSPDAVKLSLDLLSSMTELISGKKIVVLGDMLELGEDCQACHYEIGKYIFNKKIDILLTIGERSKNTYLKAIELGFNKDRAQHFEDQKELIKYLKSFINRDDLILIKGSQGSRMEKVVKGIMENPAYAKNLLVRQSEDWLNN